MAIQSSGVITLQDIEDEFGGTGSISLSEYYRNGSYVTSNNTSVPTSGNPISLSNFYGATNQFAFSITSSTQNANIRTLAVNAGWDGSAPLIANVNAGIYLWSDSTSTGGAIISGSFPSGLTLNNYGYIIGKGGKGEDAYDNGTRINPGAGGPALTNASSSVAIINKSGAYIAGGGGGGTGYGGTSSSGNETAAGGGGGAGGGVGGFGQKNSARANGGAGGAIGQSGGNGQSASYNNHGYGGGAGGGAADLRQNSYAGGGGGGRILPGVGGLFGTNGQDSGGNGGSAGNAGSAAQFTGGGGGWGAAGGTAVNAGGSGGAGGAAISGTSLSLTNSGTIYGST
jgi:hypothetical protein